jgi:hypothetical protein
MSRKGLFVAVLSAVLFGGSVARVEGQAPSSSVEEQLRSQYRLTHVGTNGAVVGQAGSVLVVQADGITAIPASHGVYWYNNLKKGGRVKTSTIQHGGSVAATERRPLQVGEKVYLVNIEINQAEIAFSVQSCGNCEAPGVDPNNPPYRARLAVEFDKGFLSTGDLKQIQDRIGQAFGIDVAPSAASSVPLGQPPSTAAPAATPILKLPSTYASAQTPTDHLQLNANNSFALQEGGQSYHGTFVVSGNTLELNITETNTKTNATIQGNNLTDSSGQTWVLREHTAASAPAPVQDVLQNQDIIDLVKAGLDDATILAKIGGSKCQFDTSTNGLIKLKQSKVSAAVIKAMVGAGK